MLLFLILSLAALGTDSEELYARADRFADAGNWTAAGPLFAEAEHGFELRGDRRMMLYARFGRLRRAVETGSYSAYLKEVELALAEPAVESDPKLKIKGLSVVALINMNLNTSEAKRNWQEIAELAQRTGDAKWANRAAGQLGLIAGVEGDYGVALTRLVAAIGKASELQDTGAEIYFKTFLGNGLTLNNRPDQALSLFDAAIETSRRSPDSGFQILPVIGKVRALRALRRYREAQDLISASLLYAREQRILGAQTELLIQSGHCSFETDDHESAEAAFREASIIAHEANLPRMLAAAQSGLVDVYRADRNWPAAAKAADAAIDAVSQPDEVYDLPQCLAKKAEIETQIGNIQAADRLYERATDLIEGMLVNMPGSPSKSSLIGAMSRVYTGHFRLSIDYFKSTSKAFAVVESARGRSLADSLRYGNRGATQPPSKWEVRISEIQHRMRMRPGATQMKRLLNELEDAELELSGVESARNRRTLREMALLGKQAVSLREAQRILRSDEILLEYVLDDPVSYCLAISRTGTVVHRLEGRRGIEQAVDRYLTAVRQKKDAVEDAQYLYAALVAPLALASGKAATIIVVPDGKLHLLPFSALIDSTSKYLIESSSVFYVPSATVLHVLRTAERNGISAPLPFLGIGFTNTANDQPVAAEPASRGLFDSGGAEIRPLPFAREEVNGAASEAGRESVVLIGENASESALKAAGLSRFRVLHIAAHGLGSEVRPERAGLVLHPGGPDEDGLWQPREIRRENLQADLVTLSACETAAGKLDGQEGVANLARTFLLAGARSVVASIWMVDDRSTATIMSKFYSRLGQRENIASAFRGAQLDMLALFGRNTPPFFWAGFLVTGDGARQVSFGASKVIQGTARQGLR